MNSSRYRFHASAVALFRAMAAACASAPDDYFADQSIGETPALGVHARQSDIGGGNLTALALFQATIPAPSRRSETPSAGVSRASAAMAYGELGREPTHASPLG